MIFVRQEVTPLGPCPSDEDGILRRIETAGRIAWKSEHKTGEHSHRDFYSMLVRRGHASVLEHGNIVLESLLDGDIPLDRLQYHPTCVVDGKPYIAGNVRAWRETLSAMKGGNYWAFPRLSTNLKRNYPFLFCDYEDLERQSCLVVETESQIALHTDLPLYGFHVVCDRGISHELVRHRKLSFTQVSTRYVNESKRGMIFIIPEEYESNVKWTLRAQQIESWYQEDIDAGLQPQIARDCLPNLLMTELIISGRYSEWIHFIKLREARGAHPRIRRIAMDIRQYFENTEIIS